MSTRHVLITVPVLAFLACAPMAGLTSDNRLSSEEASQAVSELVDSVGPAFDCDISVISIRETPASSREISYYYVSFEATGVRCNEAHEVLSYRGKSKGLWFLRSKKPKRKDELPKEPNLDLIHEIDPPVEM